MSERNRKCLKCGSSWSDNPKVSLHRFPKPGVRNIKRCEVWAKFCFPEGYHWATKAFQEKLYSEHRMLCSRHFPWSSFIDFDKKRLHRHAVPENECTMMESQYLEGEVTDEGQEEWMGEGEEDMLTDDGYIVNNQSQNPSAEQDESSQECEQQTIEYHTSNLGQVFDHDGSQEMIQLQNDGSQEYHDNQQAILQNYTLQIQTSQGILQAQLKPLHNVQEDSSPDTVTQEISQEYSQDNITQEITQEYSQDSQDNIAEVSGEDNQTQYIVLPENMTLNTVTDENNQQYIILQEHLPDGTVTEQNISAEDLSQYIMLQQTLPETAENMLTGTESAANVSQDNTDLQGNTTTELIFQDNVAQENILRENTAQENILRDNTAQVNVLPDNIVQLNVLQENVSQDNKETSITNIEETLNHLQREESVTPDLPDDLDTYLIRKQLPKVTQPVVTYVEEDKGNDTDDLLQILGESENKAKRKVLTRKHSTKQDTCSSDEDIHVYKLNNKAIKKADGTQNTLAKKSAAKSFDKVYENSIMKKISSSVKVTKVKNPVQDKDVYMQVEKAPASQQKIRPAITDLGSSPTTESQHTVIYHIQPKVSEVQQNVSQILQKLSQPKFSKVQPKVSNIQPKVSNIQPKVSNIQPKVSNIQPKFNIQPKVSDIQPKVLNHLPKVSNIQPKPAIQQKTVLYAGQQTIQQHKMNTIQQKISQNQHKISGKPSNQQPLKMYGNTQKIVNPQNIFVGKEIKLNQVKQNTIQRVYSNPQKTNANQQKTNTAQQKVVITQQKVFNPQDKGNTGQHKVGGAKSLNTNQEMRLNPSLLKSKPVQVTNSIKEEQMDIDSDKNLEETPQRVVKMLEDDSMSDDSYSDHDSLFDFIPSSDSEKMDDWFTVDIRAERAGEYLPLLGDQAHSILQQEKNRVQNLMESLQSRLEGITNSTKRQVEELQHAELMLKQINDQLKTT